MPNELTVKQIAVAGSGEVLRLYGIADDGLVYQYLTDQEANVAGGGWKKISMRKLP